MMIPTLAWRNVWRNRLRSFVVIGAVIVGVWSIIFLLSFTRGIVLGYIDRAIENEVSHIQIHHPEFEKDQAIQYDLKNTAQIDSVLSQEDGIQAFTQRSLILGMIASAKGARGTRIKGIIPETEQEVTKLKEKIVEGSYFKNNKKNQILLSQRIADKLNVKIRKKVVLTFQDQDAEIISAAFRLTGIFDTGNTKLDESMVFVRHSDLLNLFGKSDLTHEYAMLIKDEQSISIVQENLKASLGNASVKNYKEISPDVELYESQIKVSTYIFMTIFMLALVFGIINTMLMAVLERYRELGMLMSIGMNKLKIYLMIMLETVMLVVIGLPIGMLLAYMSVYYYQGKGIDLSNYSEGLREFGMSEVIYPVIQSDLFVSMALFVGVTAIIAALYPAYKAIKLKPVEAIRKI